MGPGSDREKLIMPDLDTIGYFLYMSDQEKQAAVRRALDELAAGLITQEEFDEKKQQLLEI